MPPEKLMYAKCVNHTHDFHEMLYRGAEPIKDN